MASAVYLVTLIEGSSFTTPWGLKMRGATPTPVVKEEHLRYFNTNGRFKVEERRERARIRGQGKGPGPRKVPVTSERKFNLAKANVHKDMKKASLLALCRDLEVRGAREEMTKSQLVPLIQSRQSEILKEYQPNAEAAKAAAIEAAAKAKAAEEAEEAALLAAEEAADAAELAERRAEEEEAEEAAAAAAEADEGNDSKGDKGQE